MTCLTRRGLLQVARDERTAADGAPALAQAWPDRPLRFVVPAPPGAGILDIIARLIGQHLGAAARPAGGDRQQAGRRQQPRRRVRRQGAGRRLHAADVQQLAHRGAHLYARLGYDADDRLRAGDPGQLGAADAGAASVGAGESVQELIAYAKANPGKLNYGSGGVGSTPYLATELFKSMTGIDVVHVPYKGGAPALADLVAGQLSFMIENVPGTHAVREGRQAPGARHHQPEALAAGARAADHGRGRRAGLRDDRLERRVRRQAARRPRSSTRLAGELIAIVGTPEVKAAAREARRRTGRQPPDDFAAFMHGRGRALGQDHHRARHQAGVVVNPSSRPAAKRSGGISVMSRVLT